MDKRRALALVFRRELFRIRLDPSYPSSLAASPARWWAQSFTKCIMSGPLNGHSIALIIHLFAAEPSRSNWNSQHLSRLLLLLRAVLCFNASIADFIIFSELSVRFSFSVFLTFTAPRRNEKHSTISETSLSKRLRKPSPGLADCFQSDNPWIMIYGLWGSLDMREAAVTKKKKCSKSPKKDPSPTMGRECLVSHETHIFYNLFCVSRAWLEILSRASLVMGSSEDLSQVKQAKDLLLLLLLAYEQYIGVSQSSVHNHIFTSSIEFLFLSYSKKNVRNFCLQLSHWIFHFCSCAASCAEKCSSLSTISATNPLGFRLHNFKCHLSTQYI